MIFYFGGEIMPPARVDGRLFYKLVLSVLLTYLGVILILAFLNSYSYFASRVLLEKRAGLEDSRRDVRDSQIMDYGERRRFPSALIIGGMKCGTGALRKFLSLHPDIVTTEVEETEYFTQEYHRGVDWYLSQMPISKPGQVTIEKSVYFGNSFTSPQRIYEFNKDIKLILIVRDPVHRLVSHFARAQAFVSEMRNTLLEEVVFYINTTVVLPTSPYVSRSNYYRHMINWLKYFPRNQFLILDGDRFIKDPFPQLEKVESFLNLPHKLSRDLLYFDEKKGFYCVKVGEKQECLPKGKGRTHPDVNPTTLQKLRQFFLPLDMQFSDLVGQTFSWQVARNASSSTL